MSGKDGWGTKGKCEWNGEGGGEYEWWGWTVRRRVDGKCDDWRVRVDSVRRKG